MSKYLAFFSFYIFCVFRLEAQHINKIIRIDSLYYQSALAARNYQLFSSEDLFNFKPRVDPRSVVYLGEFKDSTLNWDFNGTDWCYAYVIKSPTDLLFMLESVVLDKNGDVRSHRYADVRCPVQFCLDQYRITSEHMDSLKYDICLNKEGQLYLGFYLPHKKLFTIWRHTPGKYVMPPADLQFGPNEFSWEVISSLPVEPMAGFAMAMKDNGAFLVATADGYVLEIAGNALISKKRHGFAGKPSLLKEGGDSFFLYSAGGSQRISLGK